MNGLDWFLVALMLVFGATGWTQGFVVGLLGFVGFAGGTVAGLIVVPRALDTLEPGLGTAILAVGLVVAIATISQGLLAWVGNRLRARFGHAQVRRLDAAGGAVLAVAGLLVAAWAVGLIASSSGIPGFARLSRESTVLAKVNDAIPVGPERLRDAFRSVFEAGGFPEVVGPFVPEPIIAVEAPSRLGVRTPEVKSSSASVVKVLGEAPSCRSNLAGSGFVVAKERVVTNAHVVAGTSRLVVQPVGADAKPLEATVVHYDPFTDVAILAVPGLRRPVLRLSEQVPAGADAAVAGYPNNGPLRVLAARVRGSLVLLGRDIYGESPVRRNVVSLRGDVRPGNSGGPLLAADGTVYGLIFAASLTDGDTGYALAPSEIEEAMAAADRKDSARTGACAG